MSHLMLEVNELQFVYPDGHMAIEDISFKVAAGETIGLVGANGAGKSTLLMLLLGILFPNKGQINVANMPVTKKTLPYVREKIGMVFQDPDDQLFMNTVYDDVAFGPLNYGLSEAEARKRVFKALETVGIAHLSKRPPYKLSGGEKRAAAIAAVIAMHPDIIIMDEPTAALDPKSRRRLIELLKGFEHHTKIIASHDLDMVYDLCDRTIILSEGKIMADGKTTELMMDEKLLDSCNLELPLSLRACPRCGV